jgi:serine/threonine protein kinase
MEIILSEILSFRKVVFKYLYFNALTFLHLKSKPKLTKIRQTIETKDGIYKLIKEIPNTNKDSEFNLSLYATDSGVQAVLKSWSGSMFWVSFFSLRNEIKFYKFISKINATCGASQEIIQTPKLLHVIEDDYSIGLLITYIQGTTNSQVSATEMLQDVDLVETYLKNLYDARSKNQNGIDLPIFTVWRMNILFICFWLKALFIHPSIVKYLFRVAFQYSTRMPLAIFTNLDSVLIHRDLTHTNIIFSNNSISLIDFEATLIAPRQLEYAQIEIGLCASPKLQQEIFNVFFREKGGTDLRSYSLKKIIRLYISVLHLSTKQSEPYRSYLPYLDLVLNS